MTLFSFKHQCTWQSIFLFINLEVHLGLQRWLSNYEHWLLFQKTKVQFSAPTYSSRSLNPASGIRPQSSASEGTAGLQCPDIREEQSTRAHRTKIEDFLLGYFQPITELFQTNGIRKLTNPLQLHLSPHVRKWILTWSIKPQRWGRPHPICHFSICMERTERRASRSWRAAPSGFLHSCLLLTPASEVGLTGSGKLDSAWTSSHTRCPAPHAGFFFSLLALTRVFPAETNFWTEWWGQNEMNTNLREPVQREPVQAAVSTRLPYTCTPQAAPVNPSAHVILQTTDASHPAQLLFSASCLCFPYRATYISSNLLF